MAYFKDITLILLFPINAMTHQLRDELAVKAQVS